MLHKKIDTHVHYLPPAYNAMLDRRNLKFLDGGFPRPDWSVEMQHASMESELLMRCYLFLHQLFIWVMLWKQLKPQEDVKLGADMMKRVYVENPTALLKL